MESNEIVINKIKTSRGRGKKGKEERKEEERANCRWVIYYAALSETFEDNRLIFREKRMRVGRNGVYV